MTSFEGVTSQLQNQYTHFDVASANRPVEYLYNSRHHYGLSVRWPTFFSDMPIL